MKSLQTSPTRRFSVVTTMFIVAALAPTDERPLIKASLNLTIELARTHRVGKRHARWRRRLLTWLHNRRWFLEMLIQILRILLLLFCR